MKPPRLIRTVCLFVGLFAAGVVVAADGAADPPFRFYSVIDGLTQSEVYDIEQDHAGYLWFTTARGLNRYDGDDFRQYTIADGLPTNSLTALGVDADNQVWLGDVKGGITILRGGRVARIVRPLSAQSAPITDIAFVNRRAYAAVNGVGVVHIAADQFGDYFMSVVPGSSGATELAAQDDTLWITAETGLLRFDPKATPAPVRVADTFHALHVDADGTLWMADEENRIGRWDDDRFVPQTDLDDDIEIVDLARDADGIIWAAAPDRLFRIGNDHDHGAVSNGGDVAAPEPITGVERVTTMFVDRENSLWLSSDNGLIRFLGDRFRHHQLRTGTETETVWGIAEDSHGQMWFGTQTKLLRRDVANTLTIVDDTYGVPAGPVRDVVVDAYDSLWFSVGKSGLFRLAIDTMRVERIDGTDGAEVLDIHVAGDGAIWASTMSSGLFRFRPPLNQLDVFAVPNDTSVYTIDIADDGVIWYGADEAGLVRMTIRDDGGTEQRIFTADHGLNNLLFDHIRLTGADQGWVATEEGGLYRFRDGKFRDYGVDTPLADQTVYLVESLANGTLVVGGEQGLYQFVPGQAGIAHYNQLSGFIGLETNVHATYIDSTGCLWIGTINGATRMDTAKPMPHHVEPTPTITVVETALDRLEVTDRQRIDPDQLGVHIEFAAISLLNPKEIEYSYRMVGIEAEWSDPTTNRSVSYPRMPPGPYRFLVRARLPGDDWGETRASLSFSVLPYFWQEPWFIAFALIAFAVVMRGLLVLRTRKVEWQNETLLAQVEERTRSIERAKQRLERSHDQLSREVEERRKSEQARIEIETRFRRAFENAPIGMGLLDACGALFDANPALKSMLWPNSTGTTELNFIDTIDDDDRERFIADYEKLTTSKSDSLDEKLICHDDAGEELHTVANLSAIRSDKGVFLYSVLQIQDITEAQKLTMQLEYQASYDELTGLLNRRAFETELTRAWNLGCNGKRPSYLIYMDLDQFKVVNDTSGHTAGDQLLRAVSEILEEHVRGNDIVARLGGDEFAIILWECPTDVAERIAEAIRSAIELLRFQWDEEIYRIGVSIGGVQINPEVGDVGELQQLADAACYAAKEAGRNRIHMVAGDKDSARVHRGQVRWVQRLREAMDSNRFAIYAQPIKPLKDDIDEPERLEILLRLRDPETRKLIPPGAFLPAAERYGLSLELDQWVVRSLLDTLFVHQAFQAEPRSYWINLSGGSIGDPRFADFLTDAISRSPLPPGTINFEITETAVIRSVAEAGKLMTALREMGCQFALDDFGSGLSSFGYLKKLPVDYLKIDGMFIRDVLRDKTDQIFVKSIIDISHTLNIKTIAEFVENEEMLELIQELGADYAQGFIIGRPFVLAPRFPKSVNDQDAVNPTAKKAG